jgi:hypothetical protein
MKPRVNKGFVGVDSGSGGLAFKLWDFICWILRVIS